ncbi:hypothetical protein N7499_005597 [Penicillium canescens]|uniref:L-dopachrome isomerase n=1 Tax=Penicillium canescens TaxID=5083 RepID=A0AAD6ICZ7_PENCN|nr:uncharacterized protein N7446_001368 [Penicillium canescens]KAJ5998007.1 hypothetical protein N7522_009667 [Penicillium canescens]KAJ6043172.1 hypothetical protein N7460_004527 [Penicillium canescens]KAJ6073591.1 hypothetical protein N7446_001368 [Penicillium canescens]KAJ6080723.1 hypothetical protein N7499_005597 [Penicillium canescens]KAJ6177486.1 hypothetical protein N7485_004400 [Penicillium canescens]
MDSSKPSLPRLSTNILLLEQVPNALAPKAFSNAKVPPVIMPERPAPSSLFKEENQEENVAPITRLSEPKPVYLAPKCVPDSPIAKPMKTMYYEDAFTVRGLNHSPKDRVAQGSVVIVELKTNIKAKENTPKLLSDLALFFAQTYQHPETSVLVTVDEDALLTFGNTPDSAYLIKISALPSLIAPLTNQRNTSLIQAALLNFLGIASDRGVIIFGSVGEDDLATNGATARGEISRLERSDHGNNPSLFKSISRSMSRRLKSSSGNSAPMSLAGLSTVVSPDGFAMVPGASDLPETIPLRSSQPDNAKSTELSKTESQTAKSLTLESPKEDSLNQVSSKDEKKERGLKKRESLKSFVNRRLFELTGPRGASTPTPKRKNV